MAILMSLAYLAIALVLLAACVTAYLWVTPYRELALVREGNVAAALSLGGASIGLSMPIGSAIYFTHDIAEMTLWAVIGGLMQLNVFLLMRRYAMSIETGNLAAGLLLACLSISTGLLVALCIS